MTQTESVVNLASQFVGVVERQREETAARLEAMEEEIQRLKAALKKQSDEHRVDLVAKDRAHLLEKSTLIGQEFQLTAELEQALSERHEAVRECERLRAEVSNLRVQHEQDVSLIEEQARDLSQTRTERDAATHQLLNYLAQQDQDVVLIPAYELCPRCNGKSTEPAKGGGRYCRDCDELYAP